MESSLEKEESEKAMGDPTYDYLVRFALLGCTYPHGGRSPALTIILARQCHETLLV
jgi:hypothetical protein